MAARGIGEWDFEDLRMEISTHWLDWLQFDYVSLDGLGGICKLFTRHTSDKNLDVESCIFLSDWS